MKRLPKITTLEMEVTLMGNFNIRQNVIVPNVTWGAAHGLHECDILSLSKSGYATEVEIKVSLSDLKKDFTKNHSHDHNHIKYLFYAVPESLKEKALELIPEHAGLYVVEKHVRKDLRVGPNNYWSYHLKTERGCLPNKNAVKWSEDERNNLMRLGAMRIHGLKRKLMKSTVTPPSNT